jgi:hypothetical protein
VVKYTRNIVYTLNAVDRRDAGRSEGLALLNGLGQGLSPFIFPSGSMQRDELLLSLCSAVKENGSFSEFEGPIVRIPSPAANPREREGGLCVPGMFAQVVLPGAFGFFVSPPAL